MRGAPPTKLHLPLLHIIQEDSAFIAVAKPAGLLTQAPPGIDSLESRIRAFLKARDQKAGNVYLGVPHRLDRPVSGAMIFAKHSRSARRISKQFERRDVEKVYWACTQGVVEPAAGKWVDYLRKVPGEPKAVVVDADDPEARLAILRYRTRGRFKQGSWLEIRLETGRTHQVRIQAASRGWPLLGDHYYGAELPFGTPYENERLRAIALHARSLSLQHPMSRQPLRIEAPVSHDWLVLGLPLPAAQAIDPW